MLSRALLASSSVPVLLLACTGTASVSIPEPTTDTSTNEPAPDDDAVPSGSAIAHADTQAAPDASADAASVLAACDAEIEPNDDADTGTPFTTCLSGALATTTDRDYWSVTAPDAATSLRITHAETGGEIGYRIYASMLFGVFFPTTFTGDAPTVSVTGGTTYILRMNARGTASAGAREYRAEVVFE